MNQCIFRKLILQIVETKRKLQNRKYLNNSAIVSSTIFLPRKYLILISLLINFTILYSVRIFFNDVILLSALISIYHLMVPKNIFNNLHKNIQQYATFYWPFGILLCIYFSNHFICYTFSTYHRFCHLFRFVVSDFLRV